ncbi:hypothetical protein WR25_13669 isoform E [Diploscapter pachys]|nr:hypothetical protein WR25_13669 isoform D [Diploscapter pachys]PAV76549.1 hypothetical protein WR25_13669 isoform E [Diploscapter pachys]
MSNRHAHLLVPGPSFDQETRERSRSDSDMAPKDEKMDISQHSTISVPATTSRSSGQYKKRLLQKYEEQERKRHRTTKRSTSSPPLSAADSDVDDADLRSVSRQHTLDDDTGHSPNTETSSATTILSFHRVDSEPSIPLVKSATSIPEAVQSMLQGQQQIEEWMQRQISALHAATIYNQVVNTIIKTQNQLPTPDAPKVIAQKAFETEDTIGPVRTGGLWKGSASRGVSPFAPVAAAAAPSKDTVPPSGTHPESVIAGPYVCTSCGQAFSLHDRLAKHIASRHRERSATEEGNKTHKCTVCNKSFGRSDMLTRHMRLHTGSKPYSCPTCGQVFSRSDHLSTHLRTHTGEKPYACSLCSYTASRRDMISRHMRTHVSGDGSAIDISGTIASLSLSPSVSPLPPASVPSSPIPPASLSNSPMQHLLTVLNGSHGSLDGVPSTPTLGSGERSAFHQRSPSASHLLVPPVPSFQSLSSPASPTLNRSPSDFLKPVP